MEDILQGYGIKPQGKSAPMAASKTANPVAGNFNFNFTANNPKSASLNDAFGTNPGQNAFAGDFTPYDHVFGGPPQYRSHSVNSSSGYDDIFQSFPSAPAKSSTGPIFDAPRYDDDIFGGVSGVKNSSTLVYEDVFSVGSSGPGNIEDLLGGFKAAEPGAKAKVASPPRTRGGDASATAFDDLLPGFGNSEPAKPGGILDTNLQKPVDSSQKPANDPFVVLEADSFSSNGSSTTFHDPLEEFGTPTELASTKDSKGSSNGTAGINDIFDGFSQAAASSSSHIDNFGNEKSSLKKSRSSSPTQTNDSRESMESKSPRKASANNLDKNHTNIYSVATMADFDSPSGFVDSSTDFTSNRNKHSLQEDSTYASNMNPQDSSPPRNSGTITEIVHDRWITVDEVQLSTQPTSAPPPSRPPPPLVIKQGPSYQKSAQPHKSFGAAFNFDKPAVVSSIDELEEFAMGGTYAQQRDEVLSYEEDVDNDSTAAASAAAMKEAMDRAEAKLKMARKVREKEKEAEERAAEEAMDEEEKERLARATQEAREREEREKEEREKMRREKEREREREREKERERERERENQRFAVERATREARERAAAEARERAQRAAVERATREARERAAAEAKERAAAEARERAERQAAERAAAEARERAERAAAEAKEKAAAERAAVERAAAEVRVRAQRAAVERATAEARERAAERVSAERAAAAKERQMRTDDLESFFSMGARASSAPKQRPATAEATFNAQSQSKVFSSEAAQRASAGVPSGVKKASSAANIADDWASIFTAPPADDFQEVEGETPERRRARLERHQRTRERAAKALAEKNERDMQVQRDQSERHRMAESLDAEIKRWAAGKEGNLRALLSTLQYVLWPEAGWQPVSLTDVIAAASVKKVYRRATLCVHPDKVQQKGATLQQKYVAEKVFDLLKEAWNKFNSEELF